jgi:hypothetical protein
MRAMTCLITVCALAAACGLDESKLGKTGYGDTTMAITNSAGENGVLRTGTAINISTPQGINLKPNAIYSIVVTNIRTGTIISKSDLLTDMEGNLERTAVAHDVGEFDDVKEDDSLDLMLKDKLDNKVGSATIPMTPHIPDFQGHGFQVDEVQPPHIFSADAKGTPVNSFVVGAMPDTDEIAAPVHVKGSGFPRGIAAVDLYIVKDADKWQGKAIPPQGSADHIAGPVVGTVVAGILQTTKLPWQPAGKDLGPYDILVDVDRNGSFDYAFSAKDAADGEDKVGLTVQYGAAWWRAKSSTEATKLSTSAASKAYTAADAAATKAESLAKGAVAIAKAAESRTEAQNAKAEYNKASTASASAEVAFGQTLADDKTCAAEATKADAAAKQAAVHATKAAQLVNDTAQATKAYEAEMKAKAAQMASKHLLVNLAYNSKSRSGGAWANTYSKQSTIYTYVNPPVQKGSRHAWVNKLVIKHQSWSGFWNNWERVKQGGKGAGRIYIADLVVGQLGGTIQKSCTNSPPVKIINPGVLPVDPTGTGGLQVFKFDIVFDYDRDGYYDIGRDFLDVISVDSTGKLTTARDLEKLSDDQIFGFQVK